MVTFDRLPYRLYMVSFDSEKGAGEVQERLRREAMKLLRQFEADHVEEVAVCGAGTLPEEVAARRDPVDLEAASEKLLQEMDCLQRHVSLAGADGRLQHDRRLALLNEACQTRGHSLLLVWTILPRHALALSSRPIPRR